MVMCPPRKTLEVNLRNFLEGPKHKKIVEVIEQLSKEPTRTNHPKGPNRSTTTSFHFNQGDLHTWFRSVLSNNVKGTSHVIDGNILFSLICYGFCGPTIECKGNSYDVNVLLNDPHSSVE